MRRGKVKLTLACAGMLTVSSIAVTSCAPSAEPEQYRDCEVCPLMVTVPPGNFVMGGPEGGAYPKNAYPRHEVTIGYALGVARYETGLTEYAACAAEGKCSQAPLKKTLEFLQLRGVREMSNYPVSFVRWKDAVAYTEWLSARTGKSYRLPSESEWEYVARAGSETLYWWGNKAHLKDRASCLTCLSRERPGIRERGSFEPNRFGLFDTAWKPGGTRT